MAYIQKFQCYNCAVGWVNISGWALNQPVTEGLVKNYGDRCGSYPYGNSRGFRCYLVVGAGEIVYVSTTQSGSNNVAPLDGFAFTAGTHVINIWYSPDGSAGSGSIIFSS